MSQPLLAGAVIFAKDIARVAQFYQSLLAMETVQSLADLIVLRNSDCQLAIHGIPPHIASSFEINQPPERRTDTAIKLVLPVASLAAARQAAGKLGGGLNAVAAEWTAGNFRACDGFDPEGNVVQFREAKSLKV